jgi:hypothetical protein
MSNLPHRVCAALAAATVAAGAAAPVFAADARPADQRLASAAATALGPLRYGCVAPRTVNGAPAGWRLILSSRSAKARATARAIVKKLDITDPVVLGYTEPRHNDAATTRIIRYLQRQEDTRLELHFIPLARTTANPEGECPRVQITVPAANQAVQDWAASAVRAFGADRVQVVTAPPGTPFFD